MFAERCALRAVACWAFAAGMLVLGACTSQGGPSSTTSASTPPPTVAAVTTSTAPPTTAFAPSAPQRSQTAAASLLISAWQAGNQSMALTDATPAAVSTLFSMPFPKGGVQARGCSSAVAGPSFCDYRILSTAALIEISVLQAAGGWYTVAVRFET